jgi:acetylornithine/succinyldiaminopimelate/putrescine aminotransferase
MVKAKGVYLFDAAGKKYTDLIAGISVCNVGHGHPEVIKAVWDQAEKYMHLMVYGEFVESPQVQYARILAEHLPPSLSSVYFTNSGAEAVEGAMKLAKRFTGRTEIIAFQKDYHGSTQGALSIIGNEYWRNAFRPLLPGIRHLCYNRPDELDHISTRTACVIAETIQGEAGIIAPEKEWMQALEKRCRETGALLVLDEVQAGLGRTGTLWAFEQMEVLPDVLLLGKALGGGMPLGAFITDRNTMQVLARDPVLGHITTFGGHPVCCAAGLAAFRVLLSGRYVSQVKPKEQLFRQLLIHKKIKTVRSRGLMIAVEFDSFETNKKVIDRCIENGVLTDWFLFSPQSMRIAPPLTITEEEIAAACKTILEAIDLL